MGALILQQSFDLTDEETVQQYCFNIQWHYALNITEETDKAKYISPKTLWTVRSIVMENNLEDKIFTAGTDTLGRAFNVNTDQQRIDSVHIKSNMRRLGRIGIFSKSIESFLINLKRGQKDLFEAVNGAIIERYLSKGSMGCFSNVKPSESRKTLKQVANDLFDLVQQFKGIPDVASMYKYKQLERILREQCNLTEDKDNPVELKKPKEIPSDSLQNPSDPDASYSGHKGQGYQVQVMETYSDDDKEISLNLITHVEIEPAHNSDANALIPAIEDVEDRAMAPKEVLADTLYGSDENSIQAKDHGVELVAPMPGSVKEDKLHFSDFEQSEEGVVVRCPLGHSPIESTRKEGRFVVRFDICYCSECPLFDRCPVKAGKKFYSLRYTAKDSRIAMRRRDEKTEAFKDRYRWRAGVEATMSEYDRRTGVKHLRIRGMKAVKFCSKLKALAINMFRAAALKAAAMRPGGGPFLESPHMVRRILSVIYKLSYMVKNHRIWWLATTYDSLRLTEKTGSPPPRFFGENTIYCSYFMNHVQ